MALVRSGQGFAAFRLSGTSALQRMACVRGSSLRETVGGPRKHGGEHRTPGAYVELREPEGSAAAYYWNGSGFTEVWAAD